MITKELIIRKCRLLNQGLKNIYELDSPKIAILGLNPHAGEEGSYGKEEIESIKPAITDLKSECLDVIGPISADTAFINRNFDAYLSMYHDQGLTAFKTLSFSDGVNYTAGLNVIRTSPVHGTAYEIAGKGVADEKSFREAIFLACEIYKKRTEFNLLNENPLKIKTKN